MYKNKLVRSSPSIIKALIKFHHVHAQIERSLESLETASLATDKVDTISDYVLAVNN